MRSNAASTSGFTPAQTRELPQRRGTNKRTATPSNTARELEAEQRRLKLQALGFNPALTSSYPMSDLDAAYRRAGEMPLY